MLQVSIVNIETLHERQPEAWITVGGILKTEHEWREAEPLRLKVALHYCDIHSGFLFCIDLLCGNRCRSGVG